MRWRFTLTKYLGFPSSRDLAMRYLSLNLTLIQTAILPILHHIIFFGKHFYNSLFAFSHFWVVSGFSKVVHLRQTSKQKTTKIVRRYIVKALYYMTLWYHRTRHGCHQITSTRKKKRGKGKIRLTCTRQNQQHIVGACIENESLLSLANPWTQKGFQEINKENG